MTKVLALAGALALFAAAPVRADDYGPHRDIRSIDHALPAIHARDGKVVVDAVVVRNADAMAQWHVGSVVRVDTLAYLYDRWMVVETWSQDDDCSRLPGNELADLAALHLPILASKPTPAPGASGALVKSGATSCLLDYPGGFVLGYRDAQHWSDNAFEMKLTFAQNDASPGDQLKDVQLRPPTEAESWKAPSGNSEFFFSAIVQSATAVHVKDGTTLDVWFPFVLEPEQRYSLTIAHTDEPIGPIFGTLKDNMLHFVLPAFSMTPGAHLMGEIEYLPPRRN